MVDFPVIVGSVGVFLLFLAFFLNLCKILKQDSYAYVLIGFIPFVILEGTWAIVAVVGLIRLSRKYF